MGGGAEREAFGQIARRKRDYEILVALDRFHRVVFFDCRDGNDAVIGSLGKGKHATGVADARGLECLDSIIIRHCISAKCEGQVNGGGTRKVGDYFETSDA